jgi:ribosomal protein S18 acetylase RimI-like enzyme
MDTIQAFYKPFNLPWVWIIREDLILPSLITKQPLQLLDKSTIMVRDLGKPLPHQTSNNFTVKEDNRDLTDWGLCLSKAYQTSAETAAQYSEAIQQYIVAHKKDTSGKTKVHHFVGYFDHAPVSCLTLSLQNATARIDDVGTMPEHQHQGYATQLILHVLNFAKALGADICFLESSQAGIKVYKKLGFEALYTNMYFELLDNSSRL